MTDSIRLFLAGDVMTGRGVDQILPAPSEPVLYESYVTDARDYVELAEQLNGRIHRPVDYAYIWGDLLTVLKRFAPDARIVNLETSVTSCDAFWRGKGINYRMHPRNVACLEAAQIDCAMLAGASAWYGWSSHAGYGTPVSRCSWFKRRAALTGAWPERDAWLSAA